MRKKILGVGRSPRFSPNSAARDAAIFQAVIEELQTKGWEVEHVDEDHLTSAAGYAAVFSMARDPRVLQLLAEQEERGVPVVNSARSLLRSSRKVLTEIFESEGIPVPSAPVLFQKEGDQLVAHFRGNNAEPLSYPLWLKRSEACAQSADDVCLVADAEELRKALANYASRGIEEVLASEHLVGDLVKFYGVEGTDFFHFYYPTADHSFSKFGLERINGAPSGHPLDVCALKRCADHAAALSGIPVYGGDCIVDAQGIFRIIDFNDWPSYSRCCREAATAIAEKILQQMKV